MGYDSVPAAQYPTMGLHRHSSFPPPSPNSKYLPSVRPPYQTLALLRVSPLYVHVQPYITKNRKANS